MPFPEVALEKYVRAEFRAMDSNKTGTINRQQTLNLLTLLGYSKGKKKLETLCVKSEDSVSEEDYVREVLNDKALLNQTDRMRKWFNFFDEDNCGVATKDEMIKGMTALGFDANKDKDLQQTVRDMDANADGKVSYEEFLKYQFAISLAPKGKKK